MITQNAESQKLMEPVYHSGKSLGLNKSLISRHAMTVLKVLGQKGYDSYLVGGCVRDMLLGLEPKDFDVATNASPEQVRHAFRNGRIIGRRFKIVHVRFGREVIEVTTYRGAPAKTHQDERTHRVGEGGRLLADNIYGSLDEDAMRRDLTVNALYYNPATDEVLDYHDGLADIKRGLLRVIGDPVERYREDPVRMLRVVRFASKLGFEIEPSASEAIDQHASLLTNVPAARLFDEVLKLFHSGSAITTFEKLRQYGLFEYLFPATDNILDKEEAGYPRTFLPLALTNTDRRIQQGKPVIPSFLYAVLLWEPLRQFKEAAMRQGLNEYDSIQQAADQAIVEEISTVAIPRRFTAQMREIWAMQYFFDQRRSRQVYRLLENRKFRAGYDFMLLRASVGQASQDTAEWWTRIQEVDEDERRKMLMSLSGSSKKRRRRKKKKSS
ncbi:MAG TPA: polynucleotide adenylyltransferase PcnB [Gammaproteobacteria bacterium]|nr:MAG: poly(A) polymerase I [bacterium]HDH15175.1 polynucleotide adenylyltransferase PcnB [Gammaproteobacteria bacterium]